MWSYENISTARCGKVDKRTVEKTEKADSHRSKESMGTFSSPLARKRNG